MKNVAVPIEIPQSIVELQTVRDRLRSLKDPNADRHADHIDEILADIATGIISPASPAAPAPPDGET